MKAWMQVTIYILKKVYICSGLIIHLYLEVYMHENNEKKSWQWKRAKSGIGGF